MISEHQAILDKYIHINYFNIIIISKICIIIQREREQTHKRMQIKSKRGRERESGVCIIVITKEIHN